MTVEQQYNEDIKEQASTEFAEMNFLDFISLCQATSVINLEAIDGALTFEYQDVQIIYKLKSGRLIEKCAENSFDYLKDLESSQLIGHLASCLHYMRRIEEQKELIKKIKYEKMPVCFKN